MLVEWAERVRLFRLPFADMLRRAMNLPRAAYGMSFAHFGLAVSIAGFSASAFDVEAIETLHADFRDRAGLERAARAAQRDGFSGMLAIHPDQVDVINAAFTPSDADVEHARRVVAAFAGGAGVAPPADYYPIPAPSPTLSSPARGSSASRAAAPR